MNILLIDNYDSFCYNLFQILEEEGAHVTVWRNDCFDLDDVEVFDKIVLSPGPGIPSEAGLLLQVIARYANTKPILGVCLGEQAIGEQFGATLFNLPHVFHGIQTPAHCGRRLPVLWHRTRHFGGTIPLVGGAKRRVARLLGSDRCERRRTNYGTETSHTRCTRHSVSPRVDSHTLWQTNHYQLCKSYMQ